ncbi:MAG: response regulator [Hahellaceae bacterium]|nr:response regulator [Hahellaceae bacterium]
MKRLMRPGKLTLRFTRQAVAIGLVLGIVSTLIQAIIDLRGERDLIENHLLAAMDTMRPQATRAMIDIDYDLASDVVQGIASYPPVKMVSLRDQYGQTFASFERNRRVEEQDDMLGAFLFGKPKSYELSLYYPPDEGAVGKLRIIIDHARVGSNFLERARFSLILGFIRNFLMALVLLAVSYRMLARPILRLTQSVAHIDPGAERLPHLPVPKAHQDTELGGLVMGINELLDAVNGQKEKRALAEARLQAHQRNLEAEIDTRTRDLQDLNRNLAYERNQAERANQEKSRFLASASHDLRQPLQTIQLLTDTLANEVTDEGRPVARQLQQATAGLRALVNNLLDLSRLENGTLQPQHSEFALQPLLDAMEGTFKGLAQERGLNLRIRPSPVWVRSDRTLLEQCLSNLISNALKYTPAGTVLVTARRRKGRLWLDVRDSGVGIPLAQQPTIFNEFEQLNNPERDRRRGFGLGLAIVRRACQLLNQDLVVWSRPGIGSRFSISLVAVSPPVVRPANSDRPLRGSWQGRQILIVEDDPDIAEALSLLLQGRGARCFVANEVINAQQAIKRGICAPDLLLSDLRLPGDIDGLALAEWIRGQHNPDLPVILLTGDSYAPRVQEARAQNLTVAIKPVNARTLLDMVNAHLQQETA